MVPIIEGLSVPLLENFGITHFGHIKVNEERLMLRIANCEKWNQIYFQEEFYNDFKMYNMQSTPINGIYRQILTGDPLTKHEKILHENDLWNFLFIYERLENEGNFTFFGTNRENVKVLNYYLNNLISFNHFIYYFKDKMSQFLKIEKNKCITLNFNPLQPNKTNEYIIDDFFNKTKISKFNLNGEFKGISLSKRQAECLYYLIHGQTAKETAKTLNLSHRTVEKILLDIKNKTGISTKSMLVQKFFSIVDHFI